MGEFEDKLNQILSSPADMEKIMGLAKSLSGSLGSSGEGSSDSGGRETGAHSASASPFAGLDPKLLKMAGRVMHEMNSRSDDKAALVSAMKPYVREERYETLDRAVQIAKLAKVARIAMKDFSEGS